MGGSWIMRGKLTAPLRPAVWLERALVPADRPLPAAALLVAGPGYGKTLGLLGLAERARAAGALVVWYGLDADDADPATFFHYLATALTDQIPGFAPEIAGLAAGDRPDPALLWRRFFLAIAAYNVPGLMLVLDDAHLPFEANGAVLEALAAHLDRLPPGVHVALASRRRLPLRLAKLVATGVVVVLGPEQLRFDAAEQAAFLARRHPGAPPHPDLAALDGWPLGLALRGDARPPSPGPGARPADTLAAFVAEELYGVQSPDRQALLLRAACLDEPTAPACRDVFGLADAAAHLDALEADHLVQRLTDGGFRFAPTLREFLVAEARRQDPATVAGWHRQAAAYFAGDRPAVALGHALAGDDLPGALATLPRCFPAMLAEGRLDWVERMIAAFPPARTAAEPTLALWRGIGLAGRGRHDEAVSHFAEARQAYAARGDAPGELKALVRLVSMAAWRGDDEALAAGLRDVGGLLAVGRPEDRADFALVSAMAAEREGDMARMRDANEAVLAIPIAGDVEVATCHGLALVNLFTWALHAGELAQAAAWIDRAIALATAWRFFPAHFYASAMRAHLHLLVGDVGAAGGWVRGLGPAWAEAQGWHERGCTLCVVAGYHAATGAWREAEEALRQARATFAAAAYPEGHQIVAERQAWLAIQRRQYARAVELVDAVDDPPGTNVFTAALAMAKGRALHLDGHFEAADAVWAQAVPALEALGAPLYLARARLYAAATRWRRGDEVGARAAWALATAAIDARGYGFLRAQDPALWDELGPLAGPLPGPVGVPPLDIRLFGTFEVRQGGIVIDHWPRRKARLLLAALALYPRGLTAADLAELLGESPDPDQHVASIRVNVMTVRKLLEPALPRRGTSAYLHLVHERYVLDPAAVASLDLATFDAAISRGDRLRAADPAGAATAYQAAVAAYPGDLLEDAAAASGFEVERERYRRKALDALLWLAARARDRVDRAGEAAALERAAAIAPCEEEIYIALMRHHLLAGRPERVRQAYWDHRKALKARLGILPGPAFEAAYRELAFPVRDRVKPG